MINQNYGHWSIFEEVDLKQYIGFVYVITFEDGRKYIGAKKIWKRIKAAPCTFKRGPRGGFEESDWKSYTSSSAEVNELLDAGIKIKDYVIVSFHDTWGKTLMGEALMQLSNNVLIDPMWLNKQIEGHFTASCVDENMQFYIDRWKSDKPFHLEISCTLWNIDLNKKYFVKDVVEFCTINNVSLSNMLRLISGDIDEVDHYSLAPEVRRQYFKYSDQNDNLYKTDVEIMKTLGITKTTLTKLIKSGEITQLTIETKDDYKKRLISNKGMI